MFQSLFKRKKKEKVRKHHKSGLEIEYFLINKRGEIVNSALPLIEKIKEEHPDLPITHEVGQNMIEVNSNPEVTIPELINNLILDLEKIILTAKSLKIAIYPFGTYPGKQNPLLTPEIRYKIQEKVFGKKRFSIAMRCIGVHTHFTLPWGVFDLENKKMKTMPSESKYKEATINIFNFYIAADPALTTFAQSSPFFQGKNLAKDSRMIMYRSGALKHPESLYANFPEYGSLHSYTHTNADMIHAIETKHTNWLTILKKMKTKTKDFLKKNSILETTWSPVRVNAHGTTESRSMDANLPSIILALTLIMKFVSKHIQENFIKVKVSDLAIENPFILKNGELLIPPDSYVINKLQIESAYEGLESEKIYKYCSAFLKLGEELVPADRQYFLDPLKTMLTERKTMSDKILEQATSLGWEKGKELNSEIANYIALTAYQELKKDIKISKMFIMRFLSKKTSK